jgi:hypothetical protein
MSAEGERSTMVMTPREEGEDGVRQRGLGDAEKDKDFRVTLTMCSNTFEYMSLRLGTRSATHYVYHRSTVCDYSICSTQETLF